MADTLNTGLSESQPSNHGGCSSAFTPDHPKRWTRIIISDSEDGEASVMVRKCDLTLTDMMEQLVFPVMKAKGYVGVEEWCENGN